MPLSERFDRALATASRLHREQTRKGTDIPYVSHLMGTCSIALEYGANEDQAIAALLHDVIEDVEPADRARTEVGAFGPEVLRIVEGCTDSDRHPKPPWRERKERYLAGLPHEDASCAPGLGVGQAAQRASDPARPAVGRRGDVESVQRRSGGSALVLRGARDDVSLQP